MNEYDNEAYVRRLERRVENLGREKNAAMDALELAASLGAFDTRAGGCPDPRGVLRELAERVVRMIDFEAAGISLVREDDNEFELIHCRPESGREELAAEIEALIRDDSFAWVLRRQGPTFFLASDRKRHLLLHVVATRSRIRGMFTGILAGEPGGIADTTRALLSVVFSAAAHALENCELHRHLSEANSDLEERIENRTRELQEANAQMYAIIQAVPAGIVLVDAETKNVAEINASALKMIGRERDEIVGRPCSERFCENAQDCCPCLDGKTCGRSCDRTMRRPDGQALHVIRSVAPVTLGGRRYLLDSFVDVTEHETLAKLREDVEQITRHDLKTPLNGIIALPDIILDRLKDPDEESRSMLRLIKEAGLRMLRMINLSHDLFKMETGKYRYSPTDMNLTPLFRSIFTELDDLVHSRRIRLRVLQDDRPMELDAPFIIRGEELLVYSMLSNLIKNAIESSPYGGVVTLHLSNGAGTTLGVHNFGTVPEAIRERFFDKFTTSGKIGGSGLGTYSARLITTTMGGEISFTTDETEGTTVTVRLPGSAGSSGASS